GVGNNGIGIAGAVWNVQLMTAQFLDSSGSGSDSAGAAAIHYAVDHGATVINASWGGSGQDPTIAEAIGYAQQHNVIIVAAAGNNGSNDDTNFFAASSYSSTYSHLHAVAAIGHSRAAARW